MVNTFTGYSACEISLDRHHNHLFSVWTTGHLEGFSVCLFVCFKF